MKIRLHEQPYLQPVAGGHVHEDPEPALQLLAVRGARGGELGGVRKLIGEGIRRQARQQLEAVAEDGVQCHHLLYLQEARLWSDVLADARTI